jgi:hypothetical protein
LALTFGGIDSVRSLSGRLIPQYWRFNEPFQAADLADQRGLLSPKFGDFIANVPHVLFGPTSCDVVRGAPDGYACLVEPAVNGVP